MNASVPRSGAVRTVLLTGAAGVLGQSLVEVLAPHYQLVCLTHRSNVSSERLTVVQGDLTRPNLGLDDDTHARLADSIDWIIHSAAVTRLDGHADEIERVNVDGTARMLELAALARCPIYHVSTAFTHACDYVEGVAPATPYERAKRAAERRVRASGLQTSIFRPSIVVGDSRTGRMPSFQGFHLTVGLVASGVLPIVPAPAEAWADIIARDVAALAIKSALDQRLVGQDYFLTSGSGAPRIQELVEVIQDVMRLEDAHFARPRCMHPDVFERLLKPVFLPTVTGELREVLLRAAAMCRYVGLRSPLPSDLDRLLGPETSAARAPLDALRRSVEFMRPRLPALRRMVGLGGPTTAVEELAR